MEFVLVMLLVGIGFLAYLALEQAGIQSTMTAAGMTFTENTTPTNNKPFGGSYNLGGPLATNQQAPGIPLPQPALVATGAGTNAGTFTMQNNPFSITVGMVVDVYWTDPVTQIPKVQPQCTVSGVGGANGVVVTLAGGTVAAPGSVFPVVNTPVVIAPANLFSLSLTGDQMSLLIANCVPSDGSSFVDCTITFVATGSAGGLILHIVKGTVYKWNYGTPNPLAGDTVTGVYVSHASPTVWQTVQFGGLTS